MGIKFPSGLALSLWAIEYYKPSSRDDIALFNTCSSILNYLNENFKNQWQAKMPVAPGDNVLSKLNKADRSAFYNELKEMVALMSEAVSAISQVKARPKWNRIFGSRFRGLN